MARKAVNDMARYIDSKYLVDWCNEMYQKQTQIKGKEYCNAFLQTVVTAPTADVVPKSEGEWIKEGCIWGTFRCSLCDKRADDFISGYEWDVDYAPQFCPNCGAHMTGGKE
jgi:rubrerythrin